MGLLDWLFGRPKTPPKAAQDTLPMGRPALRATDYASQRKPQTPPVARQTHESGEIWIDYSTQGETPRRRRLIPLCASPSPYLTAIDLDQRRVRTYHVDRISRLGLAGSEEDIRFDQLPPQDAFHPRDALYTPEPQDMAAILRKGMICQLSVMRMIATMDGSLSFRDTELILEYARRESRFAVNEGWVPAGEKKLAWPILGQMLADIRPRREHLDCYVRTLNENWDNPRRFAVLNDYITKLVAAQGGPTPEIRSFAAEVERLARR